MNNPETQPDRRLAHLLDQLRVTPLRNPEAASRGKANFLRQARAIQPMASERATRPARRNRRAPSSIFKQRINPLWNTLFVSALVVVILLSTTATTVFAAQGSQPDSILYPVKTISEDLLISLPGSPSAKVQQVLELTDRRMAEITGLEKARKSIPQKVMDRLQNELDQSLTLIAGMDDAAMRGDLEKAVAKAQKQLQTINQLVQEAPEDPALVLTQSMLEEQIQLSALGENDPKGFREKVHGKLHTRQNHPETEPQATKPVNPKSSHTPGAGDPNNDPHGNDGSDPGNPARKKTPQSGNGTDHTP